MTDIQTLCRKCAGRRYVQEDGPDAGVMFTCGILVENQEAGTPVFSCSHFHTDPFTTIEEIGEERIMCKGPEGKCLCDKRDNPCGKTIAAIIDADKVQADLRARRIVEEMSARMTRAVQRPIIIAPPEPSPHEFLDDALLGRIDHINKEQAIIKSVLKEEDKKGCFGAYNYHGCVLPCVWEDRCQQSQEDC